MSPTAQPIGSPDVYVVNFVVLHVVVGLGPETPPLYTPRLTSDE